MLLEILESFQMAALSRHVAYPLTPFNQHPSSQSPRPPLPLIQSFEIIQDPHGSPNCIGSTLMISMCVYPRYDQQDGPIRRESDVTLGEYSNPLPFPSPCVFTTLLPVLRFLYPFSSGTSSLLPMFRLIEKGSARRVFLEIA